MVFKSKNLMLLYKQLRIIKITNQIVFPNHNFFFFWEEGLATAPGLIGPGSSPGGRAPHREFPPNELRLGLLYGRYLLFDKDPALLTSPLDPYNYSNTHITQIYFFYWIRPIPLYVLSGLGHVGMSHQKISAKSDTQTQFLIPTPASRSM